MDNGSTTLVSPIFDLDGQTAATISYWRWFSNGTGGGAAEDTMDVDLSNDGGSSWASVEVVGPTGPGTTGGWVEVSFRVDSVLPQTDQVRVRFIASDLGGGSIVEGGLDDFE